MKFGVREICDVVFKATAEVTVGTETFVKGQPVLYIDTAKTSTLEGAATTVYATGGKGNSRLLAWEGEKTLTFTVEDALLSPMGFSVLSGAGIVEASAGTPMQVHTTVEVAADSTGTVAITAASLGLGAGDTAQILTDNTDAPVYGTSIDSAGAAIASLGTGTLEGANSEVSNGNPVKFTFSTPPAEGTTVRLDFYVTKVSGGQELQITADKFAGYYYVEASTLFRDQETGEDFPAEIVLPKVKIQSNFTFTMAATGDPSTFTFTMDAFPAPTTFSTEKVLCAIQIITDELG